MKEYADRRPLSFYTDKIDNKEYFSLSRYGDGEFKNILETPNKINKEMDFFIEAQNELRKTINKPITDDNFYYSIQDRAVRVYGDKIPDNLGWHNCNVFHRASIDGNLFPFIKTLRKKRNVIIGAKYLKKIKDIIPYIHFIEIPEHNCYLQKDDIVKEIKEFAHRKRNVVYLFAASIATNIMIYELHNIVKNSWLIDVGSVFDLYVGNPTRGYQKEISKYTYNKNLGIVNGE